MQTLAWAHHGLSMGEMALAATGVFLATYLVNRFLSHRALTRRWADDIPARGSSQHTGAGRDTGAGDSPPGPAVEQPPRPL